MPFVATYLLLLNYEINAYEIKDFSFENKIKQLLQNKITSLTGAILMSVNDETIKNNWNTIETLEKFFFLGISHTSCRDISEAI